VPARLSTGSFQAECCSVVGAGIRFVVPAYQVCLAEGAGVSGWLADGRFCCWGGGWAVVDLRAGVVYQGP